MKKVNIMKAGLRSAKYAVCGFLVVLLALSPLGGVAAVGMGHGFFGAVTLDGVDAPVGTVIVAKVEGTTYGSTAVTTVGSYGLLVQGDIEEEATIHFYVDGQEADQAFGYRDGWTTELNLTVAAPPTPRYALTVTADPAAGGNATDQTGQSPYAAGTLVTLRADANLGYGFVRWTAPAGEFENETADEATFTMPAQDVTVTASFALLYELTMREEPAGSGEAIDVDAKGAYPVGATVRIKAESETGFGFINWTAEPEVEFLNTMAEETTFTMPAYAVTITANFGTAYELTVVRNPTEGGSVVDVGGRGAYAEGALVRIEAVPAAGYAFVNWTADSEIDFDDATAAETVFTMPGRAVTVTANFERVYTLSLVEEPSHGGDAIDIAGRGAYPAGAVVSIKAVPASGYRLVNWTGPPAVTLDDATAEETTFTMPAQAVVVIANFAAAVGAPTVTTEAATGITTYSANLNMSYTLGDAPSVEVRFAAKRPTDPSWFHTPWAARDADGTYSYPLTGLVAQTEYHIKAQVRHNDTVIEGAVVPFATAQQPGAGLGLDLSAFGCFIATAAYGTPSAEQIDVLREFRDEVLMESAVGSRLVALYYRLSPPVAEVIAENGFVRTLVRELLIDPIVWMVDATSDMWRQ
ncbi:MAG: hypothetical protein IBX67_01835 [Dehalococcoidia bacterium]|nr:hypothetical protein [Dehalococcoidia bacterium]